MRNRARSQMTNNAALVLFSGGQDSTICLAWALQRFARVETVGFDYGQRHAVELAARPRILSQMRSAFPDWTGIMGADHVLPLELLAAIGGSTLIAGGEQNEGALPSHGLPATFVPGRNVLFLAAAAALAWRRDIRHIVAGMCETDFSGYPDCRRQTINAVSHALDLGMDTHFEIQSVVNLRSGATASNPTFAAAPPDASDVSVEVQQRLKRVEDRVDQLQHEIDALRGRK